MKASGEPETAPTPAEALEMRQHLASVFLGGARPPSEVPAGEAPERRAAAILLLNELGRIQGLDKTAERLLGQKAQQVIGLPAAAILGELPADDQPTLRPVYPLDGAERRVWVTKSDLVLPGNPRTIVVVLQESDAQGSKRTELRYRHLVEQIPAVVFTAALDGGLYDLYVSPQIESLLGYSQEQWLADPVLWYERLHAEDRPRLDEEFARGCLTGGPFRADCRFLTKDDRIVWVHGEARLITDVTGLPLLLQGVAFDITETKRAEELARASLREKETLLKEIHHRVKNNLQVTSSLLKLQAERIEDELAKRALRESQDRIRSMALVHELLYRSKDLSRVDLGEYVRDLTRQLLRSHAPEGARVRIESKVVPVPLPIDVAVPCGLILNELVSNALKHAFPDGRSGTIWVELQPGASCAELAIRDDGIGMPRDLDFRGGSTLGLRLIRTLADQIDAELFAASSGGTEVRLRIPYRQEHSD